MIVPPEKGKGRVKNIHKTGELKFCSDIKGPDHFYTRYKVRTNQIMPD